MKASEKRSKNTLLKLVRSIGAVLIISTASAAVAQGQMNSGADVSVVRSYAAAANSADYKRKLRLRAASVACQRYRGNAWRDRYECQDWQRSFSPFWAGDVAAGLLASAPTYYNWIPFSLEFGHWP
jgi:hypothetical protein